jgi:hypothetical protein
VSELVLALGETAGKELEGAGISGLSARLRWTGV